MRRGLGGNVEHLVGGLRFALCLRVPEIFPPNTRRKRNWIRGLPGWLGSYITIQLWMFASTARCAFARPA